MDKKNRGILIIAEHNRKEISRISYELLTVAQNLSKIKPMPISCLVVGPPGLNVRELAYRGAQKIFYMSSFKFEIPEEFLYKSNIVPFIKEYDPEIVLIGATNFGRSLAPRIAASLKTGLTADCTGFDITKEGRLIQIRPAFTDNIFAYIQTQRDPQMATIRYKEFNEADRNDNNYANIIEIKPYITNNDKVKEIEEMLLDQEDISDAKVIISAGRGIKKREDLSMIKELADLLDGHFGASRALVDAGIVKSEFQIGYSGRRVKPKLYVAIGISGAPQHIAGMKESKRIVAINKDPGAPIFRLADIGYVGDLYEVVPELIKFIKNEV